MPVLAVDRHRSVGLLAAACIALGWADASADASNGEHQGPTLDISYSCGQ